MAVSVRALWIAASAVLLWSGPSRAAGADLSAIPFHGLSSDQGLSNDSAYCLLQDSRGFAWIGTFGGLDRFDGKLVVSYKPGGAKGRSLGGSVVFAVAEGQDGAIWAGTDGGGLNRVDPLTGEVETFRADDGNGPGGLVYALASSPAGLWIGTGGRGLHFLREGTRSFVPYGGACGGSGATVRALMRDSSDRLWIGCADGGVLVLDEASYAAAAGPGRAARGIPLDGAGPSATVRSLHEDARGRIWIGTDGEGLFAVDPGSPAARRVPLPASFGGDGAQVRAIASDAEGRIWVGTDGRGVAVLDPDGRCVATLRHVEGSSSAPAGDKVRSILRDRAGLMWIGYKDAGVSIGNPAAVAFGLVSAGDGIPRGTVRGLALGGGGSIWLASDGGGLVEVPGGKGTPTVHGADSGIPTDRLCSVMVGGDGTVYAGTDGEGLFALRPGTSAAERVPLQVSGREDDGSSVVWALLEDSRGDVWAGLELEGLVRIRRNGAREHYAFGAGGLAGRSVYSLAEDADGTILVGLWDGGLNRLDPASGSVRRYPAGTEEPDATSDVAVYCIRRDRKGRIWIGTGAGLDRLDRTEGGEVVVRVPLGRLRRRPSIFGVEEDAAGNLWLSTESGLLTYDPESGSTRCWTAADGLQDDHFSPGASLALPDGRLAFGGSGGFNLFDPARLAADGDRMSPRIVSIRSLGAAAGEELDLVPPKDGAAIKIPHSNSGFAISLAVLDFADPAKNQHALLIEGRRTQRIHLGSSDTAIVPRLEPGTYRFTASGAGNRGVWKDADERALIEVVPPFWERPDFVLAAVSLLAVAIFSAIRLRMAALEKRNHELREVSAHVHDAREDERAEMAREVHDELGQVLTAVKMGLYWAKSNARISARAMESKLEELLEYTDEALESVKDISTRLRPKALDALSLDEALSWLAKDFTRWSGIPCGLSADRAPPDLERRTKTTLFRVAQELLTNVARHSEAKEVSMGLRVDADWIRLRVRDDGRGLSAADAEGSASRGIAGMRERCSYLGGSFDWFPAKGGGTVTLARVPNVAERAEGGTDNA